MNIDEEFKDRLIQVIFEQQYISDSYEESSCSDEELLVIDQSSTESSTQLESDHIQACLCNQVNVLDQTDYSMLIGMIDSIGDPILKANYIKQIQEKISTQNTTQNTNNPFTNQNDPVIPDFEENVMKLFSPKQRKVTIPDLQKEIK